MTRRTVIHRSREYLVSPEPPALPGDSLGAIVRARLVDDATGAPLDLPLTVLPTRGWERRAVSPRAAAGGLVGLVGVARRAVPRLDATAYELAFSVSAPGYLGREMRATIPQTPGFPGVFSPLRLGDVRMHRRPVVLRGTALLAGGVVPPAPATVTVAGFWPAPPVPATPPTPTPTRLVGVTPALGADRAAAATTVRRVALTPALEPATQLLAPAYAATTTLAIAQRQAVAAGSLVAIGTADRLEHVAVATVVGAAATEPAVVTLVHPLAHDHAAGSSIHGVTAGAPEAARILARDAACGDMTLDLTNPGDLATGNVVVVAGGSVAPEYRRVARYAVQADASGRWALPPVSRAAQLKLTAVSGGKSADAIVIPTDTSGRVIVDLVLS